MYTAFRNRLSARLFQPHRPESGTIVLALRRVFILPTREGIAFAATLLLMLIGSINYGLSVGFILTFLLVGLGITAMLHTFRNLAHLRVSPGQVRAVFAGGHARFVVRLENQGAVDRYSVGLGRGSEMAAFFDIPARCAMSASIDIPAPRRGLLRPGRLAVSTRYPLGLFYAWSQLDLDITCVVYPRPAPPGIPLPRDESFAGDGALHGRGEEDFFGMRQYHPGDSPRHIAWKAAAREQGLLTKQFSGRSDAQLWLDWRQLPTMMDGERKLSQLARWILDAQGQGVAFGLRLPGKTISPATGDAQRERCLEALALFDHPAVRD